MSSLIHDLTVALQDAIASSLGQEHRNADPILRPADPRFGDLQANLAMALGKKLGKKPRDVAQDIVEKLDAPQLIAKADVAGPGFINLTLSQEALDQYAKAMLQNASLGIEAANPTQHVIVDYSSPNVAKEMHVGHLRSTVIGDAIVRILEAQGHDVIRRNHIGDWGTQFGMLIEHLNDTGESPTEQASNLTAFYQQAKQRFDSDEDFQTRARQRVVKLQKGDDETNAAHAAIIEGSSNYFSSIYQRLGVKLSKEDIRGESYYNNKLANIVEQLSQQGLLQESEGAKVVYPDGFVDREGDPMPMIVQKSDGGFLYATTDLAAARYRMEQEQANRIIYVTDSRQSQHFAMVFQTLKQANWASDDIRLDHVVFGTVLGPDRKPFKTREGGIVRLIDLIDEADKRAEKIIAEKNPDLPEDQRKDVAHKLGIGALKYADLASDRIKDYVFDWERMLAFDGNTAPYLVNAYVRIQSIFRKGERAFDDIQIDQLRIEAPQEKQLALKLMQYADVVRQVADSLEPHRLCTFLYELASSYHSFYEHCPVLIAPDEATRESRLALSHLVARTLEHGLSLLAIETVDRM